MRVLSSIAVSVNTRLSKSLTVRRSRLIGQHHNSHHYEHQPHHEKQYSHADRASRDEPVGNCRIDLSVLRIGGVVTHGDRLTHTMTCGHGSKLRFKSHRLTRASGEVDHGAIHSRAARIEDSLYEIDDGPGCFHSAAGLSHLLHRPYDPANQNGDSDQDEKHADQ